MGLIDKINELPKSKTATLDEITGGKPEEQDNELENKPVEEAAPEPEAKDEPAEVEDKEPAKDAPKEEVDAYKQRKVKKADREREEAIRRAEAAEAREKEAVARAERMEKLALQRQEAERSKPEPEQSKKAATIDENPRGFVEGVAKDVQDVAAELKAVKLQNQRRAAEDELSTYERGFAEKTPDYADALKWAEDIEVAKAKVLNPSANEAEIRENFKMDKLRAAGMAVMNGRNPAEVLYNLTVNAGYQKKTAATEEQKADPVKNFDAVKRNKEKSSGMSGGRSAEGEKQDGPEKAKGMTLKEFARLPKDKKDAIYK